MANPTQNFPYQIKPSDLTGDPSLSRLNRAFLYVWSAIEALIGDNDEDHFLNGKGAYITPASGDFPTKHTATGEPGQIAYDGLGNVYVCFSSNTWVRIGPSGTSTSF